MTRLVPLSGVLLILGAILVAAGCSEREYPTSPGWAAALDYTAAEIRKVEPGKISNLDSLLGQQPLRGTRLTLDYGNGLFAFTDERLPEAMPEAASVLDLVPSQAHDTLIFVHGEVYGRPGLIQIDPGKTRCVINPEFAEELGLNETPRGYMVTDVQLGRFSFSVGFARKQDVGSPDPDLPEPIVMGVGSDVLSQVLTTVDYRSRKLVLMEQSQDP